MDLDRGTLARLDRRLLAGLGSDEQFRMVRVPVTPAKWSTWKRYCDTVGISMGRAIAALIDHEMASVFGDSRGRPGSVFEQQAQQELADREVALNKRERALGVAEDRVRRRGENLRRREREIEIREWRLEMAKRLSTPLEQTQARRVATSDARAGLAASTSTATAYRCDRRWLRARPSMTGPLRDCVYDG